MFFSDFKHAYSTLRICKAFNDSVDKERDMKVLLLGGTGAMGIHMIDILREEGVQVFVTSRAHQKEVEGVNYYKGNAHDIAFLKSILLKNKYNAIVDFMSYGTDEFLQRMEILLSATDQYIFLSSSRVYADFNRERITETNQRLLNSSTDEEYLRTDEYALAKARQEDFLMKSGNRNWTIVRPYITYSNRRLQLGIYEKEQWLYRALRRKPIVFSKDIASKTTTLTYGADVASIMAKLIGNQYAIGEIYHITGLREVLWQDILSAYLNILEKKTGSRPKVIMTNEAIVSDDSSYQYKYDRLFNRSFDNSKVLNLLNEKYDFVETEAGLTRCLEEFLEEGRTFRQINWKYEAMFDRAANCKAELNEITNLRDRIKYILYRYFPEYEFVLKYATRLKKYVKHKI